MKRSDAILHIANCLVEPHHDDVMKEAEYILDKLTRLGLITQPDHFLDGYDDMFGEVCKIRRRNTWEPED